MSSKKNEVIDKAAAIKICESMSPVKQDDLIPILQEVQAEYGYLPREILMEVSEHTGIDASVIYGVVTFYEQFHLEPHGRHTIRCCRGTACHVKGGQSVIQGVKRTLGINEGETTEDMLFTFETVACLGACALAPVMVIDGVYYGKMTSRRAKAVISSLSSNQEESGE
ncbi:MAG: NADH-quinone oxidoreductase subunit NuoE [Deltaproteobacteria bacterium]|nr:NADH-quinone oxidoreductase subunit NuoE [Deltaproteobacteria bacterium]